MVCVCVCWGRLFQLAPFQGAAASQVTSMFAEVLAQLPGRSVAPPSPPRLLQLFDFLDGM